MVYPNVSIDMFKCYITFCFFPILRYNLYMEKKTTYKTTAGFKCLRNIKRQTNDLYLVHCGQMQCPPGYTYNNKIPNEYHLHFVLNGKGVLIINDKLYHIKKNDIFLIPIGVKIQYFADEEDPWEYSWITFAGDMAENYLNYAMITIDNPVIHSTIPVENYLPLIQSILETHHLTVANEIKQVGYLYEILAMLIEAESANKNGMDRYDYSADAYIDYALQYIKFNYSTIKVNDIANYIGINRSYLTTLFKKKLNVSPQQYLVTFRLQKAAELLKTTNMNITEIADAIGYESPLTFSKMFKQTYGVSPLHYRKLDI